METFQVSRDGKHMKDVASAIASLCNRKRIKDQIQSLYRDLKPIKGLGGRDFELWAGMITLAQMIDLESRNLHLSDRVKEIAIAHSEKKAEESFFLDWDTKYLLAVEKFFSMQPYDGRYIQADKILEYVVEEVKPPFPLRTERLSRVLDRESIIIHPRKVCWFKDEGKLVHRTGWRINLSTLKKRVAKFKKYIESYEEHPDPQMRSISSIADIWEGDCSDL